MRGLLLFAIGAAAGVASGMGLGGGALFIPALTLMGISQRQAQGVNMLSFLPAAAAALYIHKKEGRLGLKSSLPIIAAGIPGALFGALAAAWLKEEWLKKAFGLFLTIFSIIQFFKRPPKGRA